MRRRFIAAAALALGALGLVLGLQRVPTPGPLGDEATDALLVASLWHDHDLRAEPRDFDRAYAAFATGPRGLVLASADGGQLRRFARPIAYALFALPAYALFGFPGLALLNAVLLLAVAALAWRLRGTAGDAAGLYAIGFVVGSAALGYALRFGPHLFEFACCFVALALWWQERPRADCRVWRMCVAGALFGALVHQEPLALWIVAAVVVDLALRHRVASWSGFALALALVWLGLGLGERLLGGQWPPRPAEVRVFFDPGALDRGPVGWAEGARLNARRGLHQVESQPAVAARNFAYLLVGRHCGLLAYYPFAAAALLMFVGGPRDRVRWLLAAAFAGGLASLAVLCVDSWAAPVGDLGYVRLAALVPPLFFLPAGLVRRRWLLLAATAAGLWVLPAALPRWERDGRSAARTAAHTLLPVELTLLGDNRLEDYAPRNQGDLNWLLPRREVFLEEVRNHGFWLQGAARAEVFVVSPRALDRLEFKVFSFVPDNLVQASCGQQTVQVRFDSEAKRSQGVAVSLPVEPAARDLGGFFPPPAHEYYYRVILASSSGAVPRRMWRHSTDARYLGLFLSLDGEAP